MFRLFLFSLMFTLAPIALAQDAMPHDDHTSHQGTHEHAHEDHMAETSASDPVDETLAAFSVTPEMVAALENGGEPIIVDVLGVVCDFCAKAMNRTFGRRDEVAGTYVDLDLKTLTLVVTAGETLADADIEELVKKSGYRISAMRRGEAALAGGRREIADT